MQIFPQNPLFQIQTLDQKSLLLQLDRRIGELSLLYMDMVVCEALKYPMMIQLDSCRYHKMMVMMVLMFGEDIENDDDHGDLQGSEVLYAYAYI